MILFLPLEYESNGKPWQAQRQEPKNAHSHLLAMTLGQSETIPVVGATGATRWGPRLPCLVETKVFEQNIRFLNTRNR